MPPGRTRHRRPSSLLRAVLQFVSPKIIPRQADKPSIHSLTGNYFDHFYTTGVYPGKGHFLPAVYPAVANILLRYNFFTITSPKIYLVSSMWSTVVHTDQELLLSIKEGNREAFTQLYHRYSVRLYQNLLPLVKSPQIAEEIIQDLFVKVWEKRAGIQIQGSMVHYLFRIGENLVYDFFRHAAQDRKLKAQLSYYMSTDDPIAEWYLDMEQKEELLGKAIEQLPPQRQRIFRLCKLEGKSYQEVSLQLGISISRINDHIVKAIKTIQKHMTARALSYFLILLLLKGMD